MSEIRRPADAHFASRCCAPSAAGREHRRRAELRQPEQLAGTSWRRWRRSRSWRWPRRPRSCPAAAGSTSRSGRSRCSSNVMLIDGSCRTAAWASAWVADADGDRALGAAIGALNGALVAVLRYQPVIATLCMLFVLAGVDREDRAEPRDRAAGELAAAPRRQGRADPGRARAHRRPARRLARCCRARPYHRKLLRRRRQRRDRLLVPAST